MSFSFLRLRAAVPLMPLGLLGMLVFLLTACSKTTPPDPVLPPGLISAKAFAPYDEGNYWIYENVLIDLETGAESSFGTDSVYALSDTVVGGSTYMRLAGTSFGEPLDRWLSVRGSALVTLDGRTVFSTDTAVDAAYWNVDYGNPAVDSAFFRVRHEDTTITVPAGSFDVPHFYERALYLVDWVDRPNPSLEQDFYASGVGVVLYTNFFASGDGVERRLIRYQVQ